MTTSIQKAGKRWWLTGKTGEDEHRLVGHRIAVDAIGSRMQHPVACQVAYKVQDCPHYIALKDGQVDSALVKHGDHPVSLYDGVLEHGHNHVAVEDEIHDLLDLYAEQVGEGRAKGSLKRWAVKRGAGWSGHTT